MHVLVIGASRGIGLETVKAALGAGHVVRALARSAHRIGLKHPALEKLDGDALDADDVAAALNGIDAVVQALGVSTRELFRPVTLFSRATRILVPAMERQGVKRLVSITGFGAGDSRGAVDCVQRVPFQLLLERAYADKDIQERLIRHSVLAWTIARPGILVPGPGTGRYRVLDEPAQWRNGFIARADVAHFLIRELSENAHVRHTPVLIAG